MIDRLAMVEKEKASEALSLLTDIISKLTDPVDGPTYGDQPASEKQTKVTRGILEYRVIRNDSGK